MTLKQQLLEDMKDAMRAHNTVKLGVVRFLLADIKNVEIDHGEQDDAGVQKIITRMVKQMKDAVVDFEKGGRQDLVQDEAQKIAILESYLPAQMSDEELQKIVDEVLSGMSQPNMGQAMQAVMAKVQGLADGKRVSDMVKSHMSS